MTLMRAEYENVEDQLLADYAIKSSLTKGRVFKEKEHARRTCFQRDRDRIVHCTAFRRLQYKTQVFVNHEGDHYRTRLTHTLEAAQIARSIARSLRLNEDLVEAIALAHDLGHGPFGHAGEWALEELMKDHGGFEHNVQSLRIVEKLEDSYPEFEGLNLCFETLEGLKKHPERFKKGKERVFQSLEADLVDVADEIAYTSHDLDDGLRSGLVLDDHVTEVELWQKSIQYINQKYPSIELHHKRRLTIRLIINQMVMDLIEHTTESIEKYKITDQESLQACDHPVAGFSREMKEKHAQLKRFLYNQLYQNPYVVRMTTEGQRYLKDIFTEYVRRPEVLPQEISRRVEEEGKYRAICDYIAGMTDRFARDEYRRLFESSEPV